MILTIPIRNVKHLYINTNKYWIYTLLTLPVMLHLSNLVP